MTKLDIGQAKSNLSKLLDLAIQGEEIVIIIAQSLAENFPIVTADSVFHQYPIVAI
jgi:PIN domain nuclease of toxin-antitoxin system